MLTPASSMPRTALPSLPYPVPQDAVRSATMRAVRRKNTQPETAVRAALHRLGYRFRKEYKVRAAGRLRTLDIAFPRESLAVFVDGCFWHHCPEHGTVPKTNRDYWAPKLRRNVARDEMLTAALRMNGWTVLRIWEHTPPEEAARQVAEQVEALRASARLRAAAPALTAADLFAGAGGSTQGLRQAGYDVLAAVEFDAACAKTYRANHPGTRLFEENIRSLAPRRLRRELSLKKGEFGLLNACPPCQGFSTLGNGSEADERNDLVTIVLAFVKELGPRAFILENVPGLARDRRLESLIDAARRLGYGVKTYRVNATEFGVAQNRRRLIAIGVKGLDESAMPEHPAELLPRSFRREPLPIKKVLAEAGPIGSTRDPVHRARSSTKAVAERIRLVPVNGGRFDLPESHQLECHKSLGSKRSAAAAYGRMRFDEPAPTLTTRCTTPACGRFLHPTEHRGISLREAALIQTFPRRYSFEGTYESIESQIGNAVPVRMAEGLSLAVSELLLEASDG
jgi:DNA (cytosine-5)-methyltransferase 1